MLYAISTVSDAATTKIAKICHEIHAAMGVRFRRHTTPERSTP
jgi:hypothetical protein